MTIPTLRVHRVQAIACLIGITLIALFPASGAAQNGGDHENLKVLPEDISDDALFGIMEQFTDALGVSCTHCHVPRQGAPPDFASDEKPEKETARIMMRMVQDINGTHLADLPSVDGEPFAVSCMTCHHGLARPQTLDHQLAAMLPTAGLDATFAAYDSLRSAYYGTGAYDFSDASLIRFARRLIANQDAMNALSVLERNLELFPESAQTYAAMADAHLANDDRGAAIASLEKALELDPRNGWLRRQLMELRSGQ